MRSETSPAATEAQSSGTQQAFLFYKDSFLEKDGTETLRYFGRLKRAKQGHSSPVVEIRITNHEAVFFVPQDCERSVLSSLSLARRRDTRLRSPDGALLQALYFRNASELRRAAEALRLSGVPVFESDVDAAERYLMERFLFGGVEIQGACQEFGTGLRRHRMYLNPKLRPAKVETDFCIASIDIETGRSANASLLQIRKDVSSFAQKSHLLSVALHITQGDFFEEKIYISDKAHGFSLRGVRLLACQNEKDIFINLSRCLQDYNPDFLIGWNVIGFDLAFLIERARELGVPLALTRTGRSPRIYQRSGMADRIDLGGRLALDGPTLLRGAFYRFEDFRLETVARSLVGFGKKIQQTDHAALEIERLYQEEPRALAEYNVQDAVLVTQIFQKAGLIELQKKRTEISGMFLDKTGRSVAAFDYCMLPRLHRAGYVARDLRDINYKEAATGGYVMEPKAGLYESVLVLDFRSLYPSIIQTFRIDPLSLLCADEDPVVLPTGHRFSRTKHILPDFIKNLLEERRRAKAEGDEHLSMAVKILMNSFYGVMGSSGCRFYDPALPSAITKTGQWLLLESKAYLESLGLRVLYGDTDSLFVNLPDEISDGSVVSQIDRTNYSEMGEMLAERLNRYWKERIDREFSLESFITMEFEKYFVKFFLPPARVGGGAKKRYVGLLYQNGSEELYFAGMESVRSDWSDLARNFQRELYERVFRERELEDWIRDLIRRLKSGELDSELTIRKGLRKPVDAYTKNIPQHVRAARMLLDSGRSPGRRIAYKITKAGPVPIELDPKDFDYEYYIHHQLRPIAEGVLWLEGIELEFSELLGPHQLRLF